jgi:hypothetical protein
MSAVRAILRVVNSANGQANSSVAHPTFGPTTWLGRSEIRLTMPCAVANGSGRGEASIRQLLGRSADRADSLALAMAALDCRLKWPDHSDRAYALLEASGSGRGPGNGRLRQLIRPRVAP